MTATTTASSVRTGRGRHGTRMDQTAWQVHGRGCEAVEQGPGLAVADGTAPGSACAATSSLHCAAAPPLLGGDGTSASADGSAGGGGSPPGPWPARRGSGCCSQRERHVSARAAALRCWVSETGVPGWDTDGVSDA